MIKEESKKYKIDYKRGDVYYILDNPEESFNHEQKKTRPGIIISDDMFNAMHSTVTIVYCTSSENQRVNAYRTKVKIKNKDGIALVDQTRTIDKLRLDTYLGTLSKEEMDELDSALVRYLTLYKPLDKTEKEINMEIPNTIMQAVANSSQENSNSKETNFDVLLSVLEKTPSLQNFYQGLKKAEENALNIKKLSNLFENGASLVSDCVKEVLPEAKVKEIELYILKQADTCRNDLLGDLIGALGDKTETPLVQPQMQVEVPKKAGRGRPRKNTAPASSKLDSSSKKKSDGSKKFSIASVPCTLFEPVTDVSIFTPDDNIDEIVEYLQEDENVIAEQKRLLATPIFANYLQKAGPRVYNPNMIPIVVALAKIGFSSVTIKNALNITIKQVSDIVYREKKIVAKEKGWV